MNSAGVSPLARAVGKARARGRRKSAPRNYSIISPDFQLKASPRSTIVDLGEALNGG